MSDAERAAQMVGLIEDELRPEIARLREEIKRKDAAVRDLVGIVAAREKVIEAVSADRDEWKSSAFQWRTRAEKAEAELRQMKSLHDSLSAADTEIEAALTAAGAPADGSFMARIGALGEYAAQLETVLECVEDVASGERPPSDFEPCDNATLSVVCTLRRRWDERMTEAIHASERDMAAFLLDRADQYDTDSPCWVALAEMAREIARGAVMEAIGHGELDASLYERLAGSKQ